MLNKKNNILLVMIISLLFFITISSLSAADYTVNSTTTSKDINNWINNKAISGDRLIFNTNSYDLDDSIIINKSITIGSYKKTKINFKKTADMFIINTKYKVNFNSLILNHEGKQKTKSPDEEDFIPYYYEGISVISTPIGHTSSPYYVTCNFKNVEIISKEGTAIHFDDWLGNITNSYLKTSKEGAIYVEDWYGNLINSKIESQREGITTRWYDFDGTGTHIYNTGIKWKGNILKSNITTKERSANCYYWKGKITDSRIYSYGKSPYWKAPALKLGYSQGIIHKNIIRSNSDSAIYARNNVKISSSKIISKKNYSKIHRYLPELFVWSNGVGKNDYHFLVFNDAYEHSKACYLAIKYGKQIKKMYIKPIKAGERLSIKINIPTKYLKYTKTLKIDYYNKIKEENEKNNILKIKF